MGYEIIFSPRAQRDLRNIKRYISVYSFQVAERFCQKLVAKTEVLEVHPEIGRMVPSFASRSLREIIVGNYNDPITKMNQNCKTPYGEVNMFYVDNNYLEDYNMLNFDNGKELINIGYNYMETKKYMLC